MLVWCCGCDTGFVGLIVIVWLTDLFRFPLSLLLALF